MKTKAITMTMVAFMFVNCLASGLYICSGVDFRQCDIRYVLRTEQENESVEITPYQVQLLSIWQYNTKWDKPWSVKCDGVEYGYGSR